MLSRFSLHIISHVANLGEKNKDPENLNPQYCVCVKYNQ